MPHIKYEDVEIIEGDFRALHPSGLLDKLAGRGFNVVVCCGSGVEQLIGVFHPLRVRPGATIRCPRCGVVQTAISQPDGTTHFVCPDGTVVTPRDAPKPWEKV